MNHILRSSAIAMLCLCASCEFLVKGTGRPIFVPPPAPGGEPAPPRPRHPQPVPAPVPTPSPYAHLPQRTSYSPKSSCELKVGCYVGDFVLGRSQLRVSGAGLDKTVIDGNLVLQTQCQVSNLTVTGDVIFKGNQAKLDNVDFYGRIVDQGVQNRYGGSR